MQLFHVGDPAKLRELWPEILPPLRRLRDKCGETWYTADIWHALMSERASLYVGVVDAARELYMVTELCHEPFVAKPYLNLWLAFAADAHSDFSTEDGAYLMSQMQVLAKNAGADRIRMVTPRKGWERRGLTAHMDPARTIWECSVL